MSFNNGPTIVTNGLVLALDAGDRNSYPGTGTTWRDLSGNNNNGTLTNGPTFNTGSLGSIVFDGVDDYVLINAFSLLAPLTICSWVYKTSHRTWASILDRYGNESLDSLAFGFDFTDGQRLMYQWDNVPPFANRVVGNTIINTNQWYYIGISATTTTGSFFIIVYLKQQ